MYRLVNFSGAFCSKSNVTGTSLVDGASQKWHSLQKAPGIYTSDEEVNVTGVGNLRMGPLKQMIPHHPFSNPDLQWSASFFNINTPLVVIYALICDAAETYWTRIFVLIMLLVLKIRKNTDPYEPTKWNAGNLMLWKKQRLNSSLWLVLCPNYPFLLVNSIICMKMQNNVNIPQYNTRQYPNNFIIGWYPVHDGMSRKDGYQSHYVFYLIMFHK